MNGLKLIAADQFHSHPINDYQAVLIESLPAVWIEPSS